MVTQFGSKHVNLGTYNCIEGKVTLVISLFATNYSAFPPPVHGTGLLLYVESSYVCSVRLIAFWEQPSVK